MSKATSKRAKRTMNKTASIRAELQKDPNQSPKKLAEKLTSQGVKVSAAYVSTIKSKLKTGSSANGAATRKSYRSRQQPVVNGHSEDRFESIFEAVLELGVERVKQMADRAEDLIARVRK